MARIQELYRHQLANGDIIRVTRLGRKYNFNHLHRDDSPPEVVNGVRKAEAMTLYEETMRNDVLELD